MGNAESSFEKAQEQLRLLESSELQQQPESLTENTFPKTRLECLFQGHHSNVQLLLTEAVKYLQRLCNVAANGYLTQPQETGITGCLCVLSRLLPPILFSPALEATIFWTPIPAPPRSKQQQQQRQGQQQVQQQEEQEQQQQHENVPDQQQNDEQQNDEQQNGVQQQQRNSSAENEEKDGGMASPEDAASCTTLANELMSVLARLLFLNGFCINVPRSFLAENEEPVTHVVDGRFLWTGGVGAEALSPCPSLDSMLANRAEVMRCLLLCFSGSLFKTIDEYLRQEPSWISVFTAGHTPYTANLFCSLLSSVFKYDPVGYGLPLGNLFARSECEDFVSACVELLVVLLDFNPTVFSEAPLSADAPQASPPPPCRNVFRRVLAGMRCEAEFNLIAEGSIRLLQTCVDERRARFPKSRRAIPFHQELLIVLWHLLTTNNEFLRYLCNKKDTNALLTPLLFLLQDSSAAVNKQQTAAPGSCRVGLLHTCSFILLHLSCEREFAVRLNAPFKEQFPLDLPLFQGTYADLLCLVVHRVVMDAIAGPGHTPALINSLLTALCNISPFIKTFGWESCVKLLHLLERLSKPSWLFKAPFHCQDVLFLVDTFNNLLQYQYEGNQRLVYSILRRKEVFLDLEALTLDASPHLKGAPSSVTSSGAATPHTCSEAGVNGTTASRGSCSVSPQQQQQQQEGEGPLQDWVPSQEWLDEWKAKSRGPLRTPIRLIQHLLPLVEAECSEKGLIDQTQVLEFLQKTTMVGLLPVPHPIVIRNYYPNAYTDLWFTSYMWGVLVSRAPALASIDAAKIKFLVVSSS